MAQRPHAVREFSPQTPIPEALPWPAMPSAPPVRFFVPGRPVSTQTGSVIIGKGRLAGRLIPIRRGRGWARTCRLAAQQWRLAACWGPPMLGGVTLRLTFFLGAGRIADLENLAKGVVDALQGEIYADDRQVTRLLLERVPALGSCPGVLVEAWATK